MLALAIVAAQCEAAGDTGRSACDRWPALGEARLLQPDGPVPGGRGLDFRPDARWRPIFGGRCQCQCQRVSALDIGGERDRPRGRCCSSVAFARHLRQPLVSATRGALLPENGGARWRGRRRRRGGGGGGLDVAMRRGGRAGAQSLVRVRLVHDGGRDDAELVPVGRGAAAAVVARRTPPVRAAEAAALAAAAARE